MLGVTGYAVTDVGEELREAAFLGLIEKPFDVEALAVEALAYQIAWALSGSALP